jgi:hypothetical protein
VLKAFRFPIVMGVDPIAFLDKACLVSTKIRNKGCIVYTNNRNKGCIVYTNNRKKACVNQLHP